MIQIILHPVLSPKIERDQGIKDRIPVQVSLNNKLAIKAILDDLFCLI